MLAIARLGFAAVGIVAMTYQLATLNARPEFSPGNFFSFFTIQSTILAVAMHALTALVPRAARTKLFDGARGGVTLYMTITGVVFAPLLSGLQDESQTTIRRICLVRQLSGKPTWRPRVATFDDGFIVMLLANIAVGVEALFCRRELAQRSHQTTVFQTIRRYRRDPRTSVRPVRVPPDPISSEQP